MLFLSSAELDHASGETGLRRNLRGGFYRAPEAAVCFTIGSFSLVGVPFLPIFVSKLLIGQAAIAAGGVRMMMALACLTVSTVLNVLYFMVTAVTLYLPDNKEERRRPDPALLLGMVGLAVLNIALGLGTFGLVSALNRGIMNFM
jgi:multicomponent Na+:H+ antiporter subunit D